MSLHSASQEKKAQLWSTVLPGEENIGKILFHGIFEKQKVKELLC